MAITDRPEPAGSGLLFRNREKQKPSQPDYRGECLIEGKKFQIAGWVKKSQKNGEQFLSLAFRVTEQSEAKGKGRPPGWTMAADDTIPLAPERRG